jgi:hypothetical protein
MNDQVTRFAVRSSALILSSIDNENSGLPVSGITEYFSALGLSHREIKALILAQDLPLLSAGEPGAEGYRINSADKFAMR